MAMTIIDRGHDNKVVVPDGALESGDGVIEFDGDDNLVVIGQPLAWGTPYFRLAGGSKVVIGEGCVLGRLWAYVSNGACLTIGARLSLSGRANFTMHEAADITLGHGCLIADETHFMASDMHSIIDVHDGRRLNPPRSILIGDHVWIGFRAMVLPGAEVGHGSVIGAGSVVTGMIEPQCVAVGVPAKVVRRDVTWDQGLLPY